MEKMNVSQVKELESRKAELLESLHQITESITIERDNLAERIIETEAEIAKFGKVRMGAPVEEDIFDVEAILAGGASMTKEDYQKRLSLFVRAYTTNPFCDKKKAAAVFTILDELCEIAGKLDDYYNAEVAKAAAAIKEAKKAYQAATAARTQHQRETNVVAAEIRRAASHDIIGYNHLWQLGATLDDFKLQTCPGVGYDGQTIVKGAKRLISSKIEASERLRIRNGTTAQNAPFESAEYMPGEGAAIFSPKGGRNGLKEFAASLFK